jgi:putative toxin-antitoxin system antitoxin component (TIGR02293 family)
LLRDASEVFADHAAAIDWLKSPNAALGANVPLNLLGSDIGTESVLDTLGRVEHGVFALRRYANCLAN